jgi:hypothetical protein
MQVLDDEWIIEIDDRGNRMRVLKKRIRHMTLHDGDIVSLAGCDERVDPQMLGAATFHGAGVGRKDRDAVTIGEQHARDLHEANADSRWLPVTERLGTDQHDPAQPRPRSFSMAV